MFIHTIHPKGHNHNLGDILVCTSHRSQLSFHAGTSPCWHAHCHTCQQVSINTNVSGPQCSFVIKKAFSCQTSGLVYCTSCRHCTVTNIGETRCTRRQHFGELLWSIEKNLPGFPVADHFNTAGLSIHEALIRGITCILCRENAQQKHLEMRLIFQLGTNHPRGLNSDFRFL